MDPMRIGKIYHSEPMEFVHLGSPSRSAAKCPRGAMISPCFQTLGKPPAVGRVEVIGSMVRLGSMGYNYGASGSKLAYNMLSTYKL